MRIEGISSGDIHETGHHGLEDERGSHGTSFKGHGPGKEKGGSQSVIIAKMEATKVKEKTIHNKHRVSSQAKTSSLCPVFLCTYRTHPTAAKTANTLAAAGKYKTALSGIQKAPTKIVTAQAKETPAKTLGNKTPSPVPTMTA